MKSSRGEMKGKIIRMGIHPKSYDHDYQGNKNQEGNRKRNCYF